MSYLEDLSIETLRVYERYAVEVVERFEFCPWARAARAAQAVALRVVFSVDLDDFEQSLELIAELARPNLSPTQDPSASSEASREPPDVALLVYPLLDLDRLRFEDFVRRLRSADEARCPGIETEFAMAAFHPGAPADLSHPDKLVPFVRRTPDPTLQLVRKQALSGIKGLSGGTAFVDVDALGLLASWQALHAPKPPPVRERIAAQNLATVRDVGPAVLDRLLDDLLADRERAHSGLEQRYGRRGPPRHRL